VSTGDPLRRVPFGATGLEITRVGFGTWAVGGAPWQWGWGPQDDSDSVAAIRRALERGVNWIDTAAVYGLGHSERIVTKALAGIPGTERPYVFTKCGMTWDDGFNASRAGSPEVIRRDAEQSLARLGTDVIDLLQLHWPPDDGTPIEDSWAALVELREKGVIRLAGVSNCDATELDRLEPIGHVDTIQPPLSLLNRGALEKVVPWALAHHSAVLVYSPMHSGLLAGRYTAEAIAALDDGDWRKSSPDFTEPELSRNLAFIGRLRPIATELRCSLGELAIAWCLWQRGVDAAIVGARRPEQVDGWIGADQVRLDDEVIGRIDAAIVATGAGDGPHGF
jgi:aryl-alcohol dehydrogenase-like predicted oxidoreductase